MMQYLLVILVMGLRSEALTTESFSSERSCTQAGTKITAWLNKNNNKWKGSSKFECFAVSGK